MFQKIDALNFSSGVSDRIHEEETMNMKNGILVVIAGFAILLPSLKSHAVIFPDQRADSAQDDENPDAVSRFGNFDQKKGRNEELSKLLRPISESSFENTGGRAPASVVNPVVNPAVASKNPPKGAVLRDLKKKKAYQEVALIANDFGFFPSTVFLTEGVAVRLYITGASARSQCFILDQFGIRRQVRNQKVEEVVFTPDQAGKFTFNCPMNGAKGTLVVRELDLGERSPASVSQVEDENGRE